MGQEGRNPGTGVALGRIQLELDEEDGPGEVSTSDIRASEVGTDDVGQSHIGTTEVSPDEACASQAGPSQVGAREVGPDEVGSPVVLLEPDSGSHELARGQQQVVDVSPMCYHVQLPEVIGALASETFGLLQRTPELTAERASHLQRQRLGHVPEELMEVSHDREHLEHLLCGSRGAPPVLSAVGDLRDPLPRAEAVVDGATPKALLSQADYRCGIH